jgi:copper homeostasis protein
MSLIIAIVSGQGKSAPASLETLASLFQSTQRLAEEEPWVLAILPGSGINPETVGLMLDTLLPHGLQEIHLSGGSWVEGGMSYKREGMGMGIGEGEWGIWRSHEQQIREVRLITDAAWQEHVLTMGQ